MKKKIAVFVLVGMLSGCAFFTNKAKKEVLQSADKELDSLIADHNKDCEGFGARLQALKAKVKAEMEKLDKPLFK